jgi:hypothetical protein
LFSKNSVFATLIAFGTQQVVISFTTLYFNEIIGSDQTFKLRELTNADNAPSVVWRNKYDKFEDRDFRNKVLRVVYKFCRLVFVSVLYYNGPNIYLLLN